MKYVTLTSGTISNIRLSMTIFQKLHCQSIRPEDNIFEGLYSALKCYATCSVKFQIKSCGFILQPLPFIVAENWLNHFNISNNTFMDVKCAVKHFKEKHKRTNHDYNACTSQCKPECRTVTYEPDVTTRKHPQNKTQITIEFPTLTQNRITEHLRFN